MPKDDQPYIDGFEYPLKEKDGNGRYIFYCLLIL
jgi:hypothetical protein